VKEVVGRPALGRGKKEKKGEGRGERRMAPEGLWIRNSTTYYLLSLFHPTSLPPVLWPAFCRRARGVVKEGKKSVDQPKLEEKDVS
jgi:hypothetical protein